MKTSDKLSSKEVFSRNIHLSNIHKSGIDKSLVNITLTVSKDNNYQFISTTQINDDIRNYIYLFDKRIEIEQLSCSHQGIENQNCFYIQFNFRKFNLSPNNDNLNDSFIYKLACYIGLKYKCQRCSYIFHGKIRNIQLHY